MESGYWTSGCRWIESDAVKHIVSFTSGIWQIHSFCEGNTRATAVFVIKYLQSFGFRVNNDVFAENSWYFRNALVRANYNNFQKGIVATTEYLELFFENLLMDTQYELKNRYLHIDYRNTANFESEKKADSKCKNCTLNCTLEELAILRIIADNSNITQKALANIVGKSERTIKPERLICKRKDIYAG